MIETYGERGLGKSVLAAQHDDGYGDDNDDDDDDEYTRKRKTFNT